MISAGSLVGVSKQYKRGGESVAVLIGGLDPKAASYAVRQIYADEGKLAEQSSLTNA